MRVATWNLELGRGTGAWRALRDTMPADVWFLQETEHPGVEGAVYWQRNPREPWGSAIVCGAGTIDAIHIEGYGGWVVGGRYHPDTPSGDRTLCMFSVHAPTAPKSEKATNYVAEVRTIVSRIRAVVPRGSALLIGGDFNFTSFGPRASTETYEEKSSERKALADFAEKEDLIPLWPFVHPGDPLPQTLRWKKNPVTPYHCDGFLLTSTLARGATCDVLSSSEITAASDHNPVVASLAV